MRKSRLLSRNRAILLGIMVVGLIAVACGSSDDETAPAPARSVPASTPSPLPQVEEMQTFEEMAETEEEMEEMKKLSADERRFVNAAKRVGWKTNFDKRTISLDEIISGGIRRDGIPPIDDPTFSPVGNPASPLEDPEPVIAVEVNGDARAYPLRILQRHEVVNDLIGGEPVVVTFCPLCNSSIAFKRTVGGEVLRFGVSGFLRNSDLIMWDDKTESLWQQLTGEAIVGDQVGRQLEFVSAQAVSWSSFVERFPDGMVLDPPLAISYDNTPYTGYDDSTNESPFLFFDVVDPRLPAVERVSAFDLGSGAVAYSFPFLAENPVVNDVIAEQPIVIFFDNETESAFRSREQSGNFSVVGSTTAYLREVDGRVLTFSAGEGGVIRDDQTGSTWSRFGMATGGEFEGTELFPVIHGDHFWFAWASFKPDTKLVQSTADLNAELVVAPN